MFTGIIEYLGRVVSVDELGTGKIFWVESPLAEKLHVDQSLSHNGICLTVEDIKSGCHRVTAIRETLEKTNCGNWETGSLVNLERCLPASGRFDGHMVQGHIDCTGTCISREDNTGSWLYRFSFPEKFAPLLIEKGSIAVNGISLTCFDVDKSSFSVAVIPYTFHYTNLFEIVPGSSVNLEFDLLGKYLLRKWSLDAEKDAQ
ncbi:MAG: riboflavin synthase [Sediminibacterium sp.]